MVQESIARQMCGADPGAGGADPFPLRAASGRAYCHLLAASLLRRRPLRLQQKEVTSLRQAEFSPAAHEQGAGALPVGDPDPGASAAPRGASGAGQHWATAGDRRVSSRLVLGMRGAGGRSMARWSVRGVTRPLMRRWWQGGKVGTGQELWTLKQEISDDASCVSSTRQCFPPPRR